MTGTSDESVDVGPWIEQYVARLRDAGHLQSETVARAFKRVPRHAFVEEFSKSNFGGGPLEFVLSDPRRPVPAYLDVIYSDQTLITKAGGTSSASQPRVVADMLGWLDLSPGMRVLEIGAGTGYNAALISEIVGPSGKVVTMDIQGDIVARTSRLLMQGGFDRVQIVLGDGFFGYPADAPYDRVIVTVGLPDISPRLIDQLSPRGLILVPLEHGGWHPVTKIWTRDGRILGKVVGNSSFMPVQGEMASTGPWTYSAPRPFSTEGVRRLSLGVTGLSEPEPTWYGLPVGLYYYVAMQDYRAFWSLDPAGWGLSDPERGEVFVETNSGDVLLQGTSEVYNDVVQLVTDWVELGQPRPGDFEMEFNMSDTPTTRPGWILNRKYSQQLLTIQQ